MNNHEDLSRFVDEDPMPSVEPNILENDQKGTDFDAEISENDQKGTDSDGEAEIPE